MTTLSIVALCGLAAVVAAAPAAARDCALARTEGGPVEIWRAGAWSAAVTGPLPSEELKLRTGPDARAEVVCEDGVTVTVAPGTEVNLETLTAPGGRARNVVLQLIRGLIGVVAPAPAWRSFETRTPLAIAAARSTEWLAEAPPSGAVGVFVRAGRVAVRPSGGADFPVATLDRGDGITVAADGAAGPVVAWGRPRIEAAGRALGFGWR